MKLPWGVTSVICCSCCKKRLLGLYKSWGITKFYKPCRCNTPEAKNARLLWLENKKYKRELKEEKMRERENHG